MRNPVRRQNLNDQVATVLREDVARMKAGQRLATEPELARRFGVSIRTVREAVTQLVQEKRLARRQGSGTYVLDATERQHIALLMEADFGAPDTPFFWRRLVQDIRQLLRADGHRTRLYTGHSPWGVMSPPTALSCPEFAEDLEAGHIRAVIAVATMTAGAWWSPIMQRGIPLVGDDHRLPYSVGMDNSALARQALEHLARAGRRRLAILDLGEPGRPSATAQAAEAAAAACGLTTKPEWVHSIPFHHDWRQVAAVWERLWLGPDRPDALLVGSDHIFPAVGVALIKLGIGVPETLQVVTHENVGDRWPELFPVVRLVTDAATYAQEMIAMLETQLTGSAPAPVRRLVAPALQHSRDPLALEAIQ